VDSRVALIKTFYRGLPTDRAKLETTAYGFDLIAQLQARGIELEYGELTISGVLHKYKLTRIIPEQMDQLLSWHVAKLGNVCLYFDQSANPILAFNLDDNRAINSTGSAGNTGNVGNVGNVESTAEVELATRTLVAKLEELQCPPLVIASGRGYHVWCRLQAAVANPQLYRFMIHLGAAVLLAVRQHGLDPNRVKLNLYPDIRIQDLVSLRLFGSEHARNRVFSRVRAGNTLLDEAGSWAHFEEHLAHRTIASHVFAEACRAVAGERESGARSDRPSV
jgi:hypothetical protein